MKKNRFAVLEGGEGSGKAQPVDLVIPSPNGNVRFGDLKIGSYVFDRKGVPTKVTGIFPQGELNNYKVTFTDGRETFCNDDHLWTVYTSKNNFIAKTLRQIIDSGFKSKHNTMSGVYNLKFQIPINMPALYKKKKLPIDPYVLGAFIGDGCCRQKYLTISSETSFIPNKIAEILNIYVKKYSDKNFNWFFCTRDGKLIKTSDFFPEELSITGKYSYEKTVPNAYLESSIEDRMLLLMGLLDTDGSVDKKGRVSFSTTSIKLKDSIQALIRSLGMISSVRFDNRSEKYTSGVAFDIGIRAKSDVKKKLFSLPKHVEVISTYIDNLKNTCKTNNCDRISIKDIEYIGKCEMMCIVVDNDESLYLTNDYIVTHNSTLMRNLQKEFGSVGVKYTNDPNSELETCIKMRDLLLSREHDLTLESELLIFMAARSELIDKIINPCLKNGDLVISDRFDLSTYAYQQILRGHDPADITFLSSFIKTPKPSLYIYLDIDPEVGIKRSLARLNDGEIAEDKFEKIDISKHHEVRKYYNAVAKKNKKTPVEMIEIEGLTEEQVLDKTVKIFKKHKLT